jgi:hypothetical protein
VFAGLTEKQNVAGMENVETAVDQAHYPATWPGLEGPAAIGYLL